jgi:hypothetical protein
MKLKNLSTLHVRVDVTVNELTERRRLNWNRLAVTYAEVIAQMKRNFPLICGSRSTSARALPAVVMFEFSMTLFECARQTAVTR